MRTTAQYLDLLREKLELPSDYALIRVLGLAKNTISRYRSGKGHFDDDVAVKVANLLGMHPGVVLLDMYAARAKDTQTKGLWAEISQGFPALSLQANRAGALRATW